MKESTIYSYVTGFVLSVVLTVSAFLLVEIHFWSGHRIFSHEFLYIAIVLCALLQIGVQVWFFLHIGRRGNGMNQLIFAFAVIIVVIVVGGAIWIMTNLSSRMAMTPDQMLQYMDSQSGAL
jgi:cytochrome o ubiquinol oxidase operon protein cyoD